MSNIKVNIQSITDTIIKKQEDLPRTVKAGVQKLREAAETKMDNLKQSINKIGIKTSPTSSIAISMSDNHDKHEHPSDTPFESSSNEDIEPHYVVLDTTSHRAIHKSILNEIPNHSIHSHSHSHHTSTSTTASHTHPHNNHQTLSSHSTHLTKPKQITQKSPKIHARSIPQHRSNMNNKNNKIHDSNTELDSKTIAKTNAKTKSKTISHSKTLSYRSHFQKEISSSEFDNTNEVSVGYGDLKRNDMMLTLEDCNCGACPDCIPICDCGVCPQCDANDEFVHRMTWKDCISFVLKLVTICLLILSVIILVPFIINKLKHPIVYPDENKPTTQIPIENFQGWDILQLLHNGFGQRLTSIMPGLFDTNDPSSQENFVIDFGDDLHISTIQVTDTSSVYLKQSHDNNIRFIAFRKPGDSWCASMDFYFQSTCVNAHNVRSMAFHSATRELTLIISGSSPHGVEVTEDTEIILNDRIFEVNTTWNDKEHKEISQLREITTNEYYQPGNKFCRDNIHVESIDDKHDKLLISGACYGLLYLPANSVFFNDEPFQLLSSSWGSIVIDSNIYTPEMVIAANNWGSITFRSNLVALELKLAITDFSYVEFKTIRESMHVSLVTHEGAEIYVPLLKDVERAGVAARNHSQIQIDEVSQVNVLESSVTQFSTLIIHKATDSTIAYKRDKTATVSLPINLNEEESSKLSNTKYF